MLRVTDGANMVVVPQTVRGEGGEWVPGEATELEREVLWRRLQAGGDRDLTGGQFECDPGRKVTAPGPKWGWLYFQHDAEAPIQVRWVVVHPTGPEEAEGEVRVYAWETRNPESALAVEGRGRDFQGATQQQASNGRITIGWTSDASDEPRTEPVPVVQPALVGPTAMKEDVAVPIDPEEPADALRPNKGEA